MQNKRTVAFPQGSEIGQLQLFQLPGACLGAYIWNAGIELACHVERRYAGCLKGLKVLELGSGTGISAIALARLGAHVIATDCMPELVKLAAKNATAACLEEGFFSVETFSWGAPLPPQLQRSFDLVIGSEITYIEQSFEPLVRTLQHLCETGFDPPTVILAETRRNTHQPKFWKLVGRNFTVSEVAAVSQHDPWNIQDASAPVRIFELKHSRPTEGELQP